MNGDVAVMYDPTGLVNTVEGLSTGLRIEHITTFNLVTCHASAQVRRVLDDPDLSAFDFVPVRDDEGTVVGVLDRSQAISGRVDQAMATLPDSLVVSRRMGLTDFLSLMAKKHFALVEDEGTVTGIVTRSDLLKLPIRVLAFAHICQLELALGATISRNYPHDSDAWTALLNRNRRTRILRQYRDLAQSRIDLSLVELSQLCDKRVVVARILDVPNGFEDELMHIEKYRNLIAHSSIFIQNNEDIGKFIKFLETTSKWIEYLDRTAKGQTAP